jgi:hypothetical protein
MSDFAEDDDLQPDSGNAVTSGMGDEQTPEQQKQLANAIIQKIKDDKRHHEKAFKRMRRDMQVAMWGAEKEWGSEKYRANIAGRHVKQKTAALYAKNPKATAKRREQLDFALWDENPASLMLAMQTIQLAQQAAAIAASSQPEVDPVFGTVSQPEPQLPPGFEQAQALLADFQQGYARRQLYDKIGKTLELLFGYSMDQQMPLDFKRGMKSTVRRTVTTGVGYVELGFQREMGKRPGLAEQMADAQVRLDHLRVLAEQIAEGDYDEDAAERAELELSLQSLQTEQEIILREGLIVDYPQSTKVIPDKLTKSLDGFIGARHISIEYLYTCNEVREIFGVDLGDGYTGYTTNAGSTREISANDVLDDDYEWSAPKDKKSGMVCVWKHYDKPSGLVYYVADGYAGFLRPPAAPDVFVETFWPVFALTFNAVESEDELFPPSDVSLMIDMQREHNRSRQGMREHREAARPRWAYANGSFGDEEDPLLLKNLKPFEMVGLNLDPTAKLQDILQVVPVPGVDPNLYETGQIFGDTQMVVGTQEAQFGGTSKATATESAIAANSTTSSDGSAIDDLDAFLTVIARASGQILQREMTEEIVKQIVGPGAVWPELTLAEISGEIFLEVAAGSTGKPNQAVEISNLERLLPMLLQMPSINQEELARETLRRMDDRMDLTKMIVAGMPSIVAQNQNAQPSPANPMNDPNAQGGKGAGNTPAAPGGPGGTGPAFGSNQVAARV